MFSAKTLNRLIDYAIRAHADHPREAKNAFRKMDGKTPYASHPIWCAMAILAEPTLPEDIRELGARILLFHDLLEDTTAVLPPGTPPQVEQGVADMTFVDVGQEIADVWKRGDLILLLKLYDKTHGLLDRRLAPRKKRRRNARYALRLAKAVDKAYGPLNITVLCRALCADID